ncbi:MAG: ABC transporter substrate-binding protein [Betaproteobacteria bacterium]|nr:ABC transporter substrate-binding protein [Betaproteobacteria bacterium]
MTHRLVKFAVVAATVFAIAGCAGFAPQTESTTAKQAQAAPAAVRQSLVPTGTLRVGVYRGSPTSLVTQGGQPAGIAHDLGLLLSRELGVPVQVVEHARIAQVIDALKAGQVDFTFTNATEARAREVDFTAPLVRLELGYLVAQGSRIARIEDIDQPGMRVGVSEGSSSQGVLGRLFRHATLVPAASLDVARRLLADGRIDAFATNKGILHELADTLAGSRILEGRWGLETMAIAIPKGRDVARPWLQAWADSIARDGRLATAVQRSGLRGVARDTPTP